VLVENKPKHQILLGDNYLDISHFFSSLSKLHNGPLHVNLWSGFGEVVQQDIKMLKEGSVLVTHVKANFPSMHTVSLTCLQRQIRDSQMQNYVDPFQDFMNFIPYLVQGSVFSIYLSNDLPDYCYVLERSFEDLIKNPLEVLSKEKEAFYSLDLFRNSSHNLQIVYSSN
jgi:hypothetical protein